MSYPESAQITNEQQRSLGPTEPTAPRKIGIRTKAALIGIPLAAVCLVPASAALSADTSPTILPGQPCEASAFETPETQLSGISDKPISVCLGEQSVRLSFRATGADVSAEELKSESAKKPKPKKCDTFYFDTKVRYTHREYSSLRTIVSGERPEGWSKEKYRQARSLPLAPNESCNDRAKLYELNNFEARLRKEHPKEILSVLGKQKGWSDYEIASAAAIIEGGMGVPENKAENPVWNPCLRQGENDFEISCEKAVAEDHPSTKNGYGLCQSTPGDKMASTGKDWKTNPIRQVEWCIDYLIKQRGGPVPALRFKIRFGFI